MRNFNDSQDNYVSLLSELPRRDFIKGSSLGLLGAYALASSGCMTTTSPTPSAPPVEPAASSEAPFFNDARYSPAEMDQFYGRGLHSRAAIAAAPGPPPTNQHMIFYYDNEARMLVNPGNVVMSLAAAKYSLTIRILNTHVSRMDFDSTWKNLKHDAQMQLALTSAVGEGLAVDDVTWTLMNGIDIFLGGDLKGVDKRLRPFVEKNEPTSKFRPSEKVEILKGSGFFQLQLAAQKKDSWWRKLLTTFGAALDSPLFATLPIPKLLPQAVQFTSAVLNHVKKTEPLVPIWQSAGIPFVLYPGATPASEFKLRPGRWLTIDRVYAEQHLDERSNLKDHVIDVLGQFDEVKTKGGQPVDANYSVLQLDFPSA